MIKYLFQNGFIILMFGFGCASAFYCLTYWSTREIEDKIKREIRKRYKPYCDKGQEKQNK